MLRLIAVPLSIAVLPIFGQGGPAINLSGLVTDTAGTPVAAAAIRLENLGLTATSGPDGRFALTSNVALRPAPETHPHAAQRDGKLFLSIAERASVTVSAHDLEGRALAALTRHLQAGSHVLAPPRAGSGVHFLRVEAGGRETVIKAFALEGLRVAPLGRDASASPLARRSAGAPRAAGGPLYDVISASKAGFLKSYVSISRSDSANIRIKLLGANSPKFSFFVTSQKALQELSKNDKGFGGDFRFGETGPGAGLRGADKICAAIAEKSLPHSSFKGWRAFLSVTADAHGKQVHAADRIGNGPWHDRVGRLVAPTRADLINIRPRNGDPAIRQDLPAENGIPNHRPDPTRPEVDNHRTVTGSNAEGKLKSASSTCKDWTTSDGSAANGQPGCGLSWSRGNGTAASDSWISSLDNPGCAPGYEFGLPREPAIIGGGGGYGGFYCFALNP